MLFEHLGDANNTLEIAGTLARMHLNPLKNGTIDHRGNPA
jgi:hypothetical protein